MPGGRADVFDALSAPCDLGVCRPCAPTIPKKTLILCRSFLLARTRLRIGVFFKAGMHTTQGETKEKH